MNISWIMNQALVTESVFQAAVPWLLATTAGSKEMTTTTWFVLCMETALIHKHMFVLCVSLQLDAAFITNATTADLKRQIDIGRPTPCGWLHKGMVQFPSGGGHYSVIIGYNDTGWWVHDPNGEADLVSGGYVSNSIHAGVAVKYSYKNWNPRWIVEGEGSGWMMDIWDPAGESTCHHY